MPITNQLIQQYQHPRIRLVVGSVTIEESDIVSGSFSYKAGTSGGGAFAPGGCVVSQCSFGVKNGSGQYSNTFPDDAEVLVYVGYGASPATAEWELLCTVYVAEVVRRSGRINIQCNDKLRKADKKKWTTYVFPMTVNQIIQSACTEAGITVAQLPVDGGSISVDLRDDDGNQPDLSMTCRQAIANALLISGNYGLMNASGQLVCGWYSRNATASIDLTWLFDYEIADANAYTGVQVAGQAITGTDVALYVLSSNAFITDDNKAAVQSRLYDALVGFAVPKISVSAVLNPLIRPGSTVSLIYPQAGTSMTAVFPLMDISVHGGMLASYSSSNISADVRDDKRTSQRDANEAVARGDYATKQYVDDAVASGGGGGGGSGESIVIPIKENRYMYIKPDTVTAVEPTKGWYITPTDSDGNMKIREYNAAGVQMTIPAQSIIVPRKNIGYGSAQTEFTIRIEFKNFQNIHYYVDIACEWNTANSAIELMIWRDSNVPWVVHPSGYSSGAIALMAFPFNPYLKNLSAGTYHKMKYIKKSADLSPDGEQLWEFAYDI